MANHGIRSTQVQKVLGVIPLKFHSREVIHLQYPSSWLCHLSLLPPATGRFGTLIPLVILTQLILRTRRLSSCVLIPRNKEILNEQLPLPLSSPYADLEPYLHTSLTSLQACYSPHSPSPQGLHRARIRVSKLLRMWGLWGISLMLWNASSGQEAGESSGLTIPSA